MIRDEDLIWWLSGPFDYAPAGITITCPNCKRDLYKLRRRLNRGDIIHAESLDPAGNDGPDAVKYSRARCPFCANGWYDAGSSGIHTSIGWLPNA